MKTTEHNQYNGIQNLSDIHAKTNSNMEKQKSQNTVNSILAVNIQ